MLPLHMFAKNTWFHTKSSLWDESKMAAMVHNEEKNCRHQYKFQAIQIIAKFGPDVSLSHHNINF